MVRTYLLNELRADLFKDLSRLCQSENICDVRFRTKNGDVWGQKLFLFSAVPFLKELVCDFCISSHEELTFVLPEFSNLKRKLLDPNKMNVTL